MIVQPLGNPYAGGQQKKPVATPTGRNVIEPLPTPTRKPVVRQKTAPIVTPKPKKSLLQEVGSFIKQSPFQVISGLNKSKIGQSIVGGAKTLPGMAKQATGIIIDNFIKQKEVSDSFFNPLKKLVGVTTPKFESDKVIKTRAVNYAKSLRELGFQSQQKETEEFAKTYTPSPGFAKYVEMAAFNLPQVIASTGLSLATSLITKNPALGAMVGMTTSYGLGASEVYNEARSQGLTDRDAIPLSVAGGTFIGALDFLPLERLLRKTAPVEAIKKSIIKKIASGIVSAGVQTGWEGITEGMQEIVGNAIAKTYNEEKDLFEGVTEAAIVGALLGGTSDVTLTSITGLTSRKSKALEKKIQKSVDTPAEERTEEQKEIADAVLTRELTPDEATAFVIDNNLDKSKVGKAVMLSVVEARKQDKNLRISPSSDEKSMEISLVDIRSESDIGEIEITPVEERTDEQKQIADTPPSTGGETVTLYRAAPKFPTDKFDKGTYFADDAQKAQYYSESHYKGNPSDIKVEQFTVPKSAVFKEPSTGNYILKSEVPVAKLSTGGEIETTPVVESEKVISKFQESVSPFVKEYGLIEYKAEEYANMKVGISKDGTTGYAVKSDGDIVNVFNKGKKGQGALSVIDAIENGGTKLDAFGSPSLINYYKDFGFREVKREKWNDEFAPEGWDYEKNGRPDIIYMTLNKEAYEKYKSENKEKYQLGDGAENFERNFRSVREGDRRKGEEGITGREKETEKVTPSKKPRTDLKITYATNLSSEGDAIQKRFGKYLEENYQKARSTYKKNFGKVLNTDNARELSPDYAPDGIDKVTDKNKDARSKHAVNVHEPASSFIKQMYLDDIAAIVADGKTPNVFFTAGGTGVGKSTSIRDVERIKALQDSADIIYDTNINTLDPAVKKIDIALKAGGDVQVVYVHRSALEAFVAGALRRADRMGRTVPLIEHIKTHIGSPKTFTELNKKYKNNDSVDFAAINNTRGKGNAVETDVDITKRVKYNESELKATLLKSLKEEYDKGNISKAVYEGTRGSDRASERETSKKEPSRKDTKDSEGDGKKPQREREERVVPSKETPVGTGQSKNSRLYERVRDTLGIEYESKNIKYNELSLQKQATKVVDLIENNPEKATRIAKGYEEAPAGMTQSAMSIALAETARANKDFKTASELWTKASLRLTRAGQEIVSVRGDFSVNEPLNAVKNLLNYRMNQVSRRYKDIIQGLAVSEGATMVKKVDSLVKHEAKKVKKILTKKQQSIQSAQQIINALKCK